MTLMDASVTYKQSVSQEMTDMKDLKTNNFKDLLTKTYDANRPDQPLQLACKNKSYETQGQVAAENLMSQPPSIGSGGLSKEGNQMCANTIENENINLKPATVNLVHDKGSCLICSLDSGECLCLYCPAFGPVYMQAELQLRLTENPRPRFLAQILHAHRDAVRAHSLAEAQTQSLLCPGCVNCTPNSD